MPLSSVLGGYKPDSFGKPDSYGSDGYGAEAKYGPRASDGKGLSPYEGNSQSPMGNNGFAPPPVNDATVQSLGAGTHIIALTPTTFELIVVSQAVNGRYVYLTSTIITVLETQTGNSGNDSASDGSHGVSKGDSHFGSTPISGVGSNTGQTTDQNSHIAPQIVALDVPATATTTVLAQATKLSTLTSLNPTATATPIQASGDIYTNRVAQQLAGAAIAFDMPVAGNLLTAGMNVISNVQKLAANQKAGLVTIASTADAANWPVQKASLASMPLNIHGVEKALEKVMGELGHLGTTFTDWLDARHLTAAAITVSVITIGGGTSIYLRRRGNKQGLKRDDEEASSSWLFARLHSAPDAS
jgi:hypothetical protein